MPLDTRIPLMVNPVQMPDFNALSQQRFSNAANIMQMQAAQRTRQREEKALTEQNAMRQLYSTSLDPKTGQIDQNKLLTGLAGMGRGDLIPQVQETFAGLKEKTVKADTAEIELAITQNREAIKEIAGLTTPGQAVSSIAAYRDGGKLAPEKADALIAAIEANPASLPQVQEQMLRSSLDAEKQLNLKLEEMKFAETKRSNRTQEGFEGQRVGLDRQRLGLEGQRVALEGRRLATDERKAANLTAAADNLTPKEIQKRAAAKPKATAALKQATHDMDQQIKDLKALRNDPGLSGITGGVMGRLPSMSGKSTAAQARLSKIMARGQFSALQAMRNNSPTGGALGNISDAEGKALRASVAALDQSQDTASFQAAIDDYIADLEYSKGNISTAYDETYSYERAGKPGVSVSNW